MALVSKQEIAMLIQTLKRLDVRGFDSMDMIVGAVAFLNDVMERKLPEPDEANKAPEE